LAWRQRGSIIDRLKSLVSQRHRIVLNRYRKRAEYVFKKHCFPVTFGELASSRRGCRVFANSIPKAGTNLLNRLLNLMPCIVPRWTYHLDLAVGGFFEQLETVRKGQVVTAHAPWTRELADALRARDFKVLLMVRDLRDIALSSAHYVTHMDRSHRLHEYFKQLGSDDERLMASIRGIEARDLPDGQRSKSWGEHAAGYLPWLDEEDCLLIHFEDLIGQSGGGTRQCQVDTVNAVARHLGLDLSRAETERISRDVFFRGSRTFRKGRIGSWREAYGAEHIRSFKETAGDALIRLGYEEDENW
jgi:hypothetical protein